jgi:hypothetical protein
MTTLPLNEPAMRDADRLRRAELETAPRAVAPDEDEPDERPAAPLDRVVVRRDGVA